MDDCAVCFDAIDSAQKLSCLRYFMPCGCRILLCDDCVTKVAQEGMCLWCRKRPTNPPPPFFDAAEAANLLAVSTNTIATLRSDNQEVRWQNMMMRVEMYHFQRFQWYKGWGFILGTVGGMAVGMMCGTLTKTLLGCGILSFFRYMAN